MKPLGKISLHQHGNDENRIGPNKRNDRLPPLVNLENILEEHCPLSLTCDVRPVHPPYFFEFCYHDMMSGINLTTLSAEITARMAEKASKLRADRPFPIGEVVDKYNLGPAPINHRKVIFLAGSNSVGYMDQSKIQQLMHDDDEWVIKIHPVTNDGTIRELASVYGYHRLIEPKVSGMVVLDRAQQIATMSTSEMFVMARLLGKPVIDVTRYDKAWLTCYHHIVRLLDGTDKDIQIINNVLMSDLSGHLRVGLGPDRCRDLVVNYYTEAMKEREKFKMITNQKLTVADKTFVDWK